FVFNHSLGGNRVAALYVEAHRQRLPPNVITVHSKRVDQFRRDLCCYIDSISDIEAGLFAIGLYKPNTIARRPFSLKLRLNFRIKDDDASPPIKRLCNSSIHSLEAQLEIVRVEHNISDFDSAIFSPLPIVRTLRSQNLLKFRANPRA